MKIYGEKHHGILLVCPCNINHFINNIGACLFFFSCMIWMLPHHQQRLCLSVCLSVCMSIYLSVCLTGV